MLGCRKSTIPKIVAKCLLKQTAEPFSHAQCYSVCSNKKRALDDDPAFQWARANQLVAQRCLDPPTTKPISSFGGSSWEDFWLWRLWKFPEELENSEMDLVHGQSLTTHVLSSPLTTMLSMPAIRCETEMGTMKSRKIKWCCLGARMEASLPVSYWSELLLLLQNKSPTTEFDLSIDFIGPEVNTRQTSTVIKNGSSELSIRWVYQGKFHDYFKNHAQNPNNDYDVFLLLNPGVGHPNLRNDWQPTLDLLLHDVTLRKSKIVLTAHSETDATRDCSHLSACGYGPLHLDYKENPYASRIRYQDPLQANHIVRPNHYIASIPGHS